MDKMKIEQNTLSRDWIVVDKGRRFFVNFTESDGQTLALCNRGNWQVHEEQEGGMVEVHEAVDCSRGPEKQRQSEEGARRFETLVDFCIGQWDNTFIGQIHKTLKQHLKNTEQ